MQTEHGADAHALHGDLQQIVDGIPALIGYVDTSLHLRFCNRTFAEWFGHPLHEIKDRPVERVIGKADFGFALPYMKAALAGIPQKYEWSIARPPGTLRHVAASYIPRRDINGKTTGFFVHVKDVTKLVESRRELERHRDQLEVLVSKRTEELQAANRSLAEQIDISRAETKVMEMICTGAPLTSVLEALAVAFEQFSQKGICSMLVADERTQRLRREIAGGLPPDFAAQVNELPIAERGGSTGTAAFTRRPVVAEDIARDPNWEAYREVALRNGIRSSWSAPVLSVSGKLFGILAIYYPDPGSPPARDKELVERASHLATIAFEREEARARLEYLATHDALTHLPNRHLFQITLSKAIAHAQRAHTRFALMFVDLDRFKLVNDELGHDVGDELLKQVAQRLVGTLRTEDTLARLGGDEFVVLIENIRHIEDAENVAEKLNQALARRFDLHGHEVEISCSIGISIYPLHGLDGHTLLKKADTAMYFTKTHGRHHHTTYAPAIDGGPISGINLEMDLRIAQKRDEFLLHYQPKYEAMTGRITGVEALVRWHHPALGILEAERFVPLAEATGLLGDINRWVITEACRQNKRWLDAGHRLRVAVNVSDGDLRQPSFAGFILDLLADIGLPPDLLELELNESSVVQHEQISFNNLAALKARGVYVIVDDFGNGYSSLSYLKRLPVDGLKIDRAFTQDLPHDPDAASIVNALLALAKSLRLGVTAIGVERPEQASFLAERGCDSLQGRAISEPMSADKILSLLVTPATRTS